MFNKCTEHFINWADFNLEIPDSPGTFWNSVTGTEKKTNYEKRTYAKISHTFQTTRLIIYILYTLPGIFDKCAEH